MDPKFQELCERIEEKIQNVAVDIYQLERLPQILRCKILKNLYSHTIYYRLKLDGREQGVYAKVFPNNYDAQNSINPTITRRARTEFDILEKLTASFADTPKLSVVKPIALIPDCHTIVTEEAVGLTLQERISAGARKPFAAWHIGNLENLCERSGEWLQIFHESTRQSDSIWDGDAVAEYCDIRLRMLVQSASGGVDQCFADQIGGALQRYIDLARQGPILIAGRHNDFAGHNIIVGPDNGISVLDFTMFDYGSNVFDYCNFIHKIREFDHDPRFGRVAANRLVAAFKTGYGAVISLQSPMPCVAKCQFTLNKLLGISDMSPRNPLRRLMNRRKKLDYLRWLADFSKQD